MGPLRTVAAVLLHVWVLGVTVHRPNHRRHASHRRDRLLVLMVVGRQITQRCARQPATPIHTHTQRPRQRQCGVSALFLVVETDQVLLCFNFTAVCMGQLLSCA